MHVVEWRRMGTVMRGLVCTVVDELWDLATGSSTCIHHRELSRPVPAEFESRGRKPMGS
jgi:hypothetical protein